MRKIPIGEIPNHFQTIALQNGKAARLYAADLARVVDINPNEDIIIYRYMVPCPFCGFETRGAYSYDGVFFSNTQMCCSDCGIYYRPVILRRTT